MDTSESSELSEPRIWGPQHLADFCGLSIHWVYKITKSSSPDPPPRCSGLGRLRFDTHSKDFQDWIARRISSRAIDRKVGNHV